MKEKNNVNQAMLSRGTRRVYRGNRRKRASIKRPRGICTPSSARMLRNARNCLTLLSDEVREAQTAGPSVNGRTLPSWRNARPPWRLRNDPETIDQAANSLFVRVKQPQGVELQTVQIVSSSSSNVSLNFAPIFRRRQI